MAYKRGKHKESRISIEEALEKIQVFETEEGRRVTHTYRSSSIGPLGADWDSDEVVAAIKEAGGASLSGPSATAMKHGLVIFDGVDGNIPLFLQTKEDSDG